MEIVNIHDAFVNQEAVSCSSLDEENYEVFAIRELTTEFGQTYMFLLGNDLKAVWATPSLKNLISTKLTETVKRKVTEKEYGYFVLPGNSPFATLTVMSSKFTGTIKTKKGVKRPSKLFSMSFSDEFCCLTESSA